MKRIIAHTGSVCYYNVDLGVSSLDHRRREEVPVNFFKGNNE